MTGDEIRRAFLQFFETRGHTVIPGSSLVPQDDPTLLLTSAGMVQIKPYFMGLATPPSPRLASCQKCFRTSDIDSVGDNTHLTFFEMLGNFSVGDYFKKEAISWAWEFVMQWLKLPAERLWITILLDDDEAHDYWVQTGVDGGRIVRLGEEDNFWGPAGDSGPCGPCSEILYDFGEEFGCGKPDCGPECDCGRFSEIWNLVFTQYNQDRAGNRTPLPKPNIDTGMGLERVAAIMQGKTSVYDTDLLAPVVAEVAKLTGKKYGSRQTDDRYMRIAAEHSRGITFLIADGVTPGNEGRGYVLRRILRRASMFGRKLGFEEPFVTRVADAVVQKMGDVYPEVRMNRELILSILGLEEERFGQALSTGLNWLDRIMERAKSEGESRIHGEDVFMLYDTYGFPKELTAEIASERGFEVDLDGFEDEMETQRERARAAQKFTLGDRAGLGSYEGLGVGPTPFVGYEEWRHECTVVALIVAGAPVDVASQDDEVEIILSETPFYGEMGGQVGDSGDIRSDRGKVSIRQAVRLEADVIVHQGRVIEGQIAVGDSVQAEVDLLRRLDIARNHTATHLLQAALRAVLGQHVRQSGSLVAPERFRFDFTHLEAVSREQLLEVQHIVNAKIRENLPVIGVNTSYEQALSRGAIALFGEKYGDTVRMVQIGDPPFSIELCGGTHVAATGEIGLMCIIAEGSIGSGMRRIEAVTGTGAEKFVEQRFSVLEDVAQGLQTSPDSVGDRLSATLAELDSERKRAAALERRLARHMAESLLSEVEVVDGINVISAMVAATSPEAMREMGDLLKERLGSGVIVLAAVCNDRPNFVAMVTPDLLKKGLHAGEIVRHLAKATGGGGGGRPELGQGSGKDKRKVKEALGLVKGLLPH